MNIQPHQHVWSEDWSLSACVTDKMEQWNAKDNCTGTLGPRFVGLITTTLTNLVDFVGHLALAALKMVTGLVAGPVNCVARFISEEDKPCWSEQLEWSSAIVNISRAWAHAGQAVLQPLGELLSPTAAARQNRQWPSECPVHAQESL